MTPTPIIPKADEGRVTPNLVGFCQEIMDHWPEGAPDGGDLQEIATKHGLLVPEHRHSFCDKDEDSDLGACACRELCDAIDIKRGFDCYRMADLSAPSPDVGGEVTREDAVMASVAFNRVASAKCLPFRLKSDDDHECMRAALESVQHSPGGGGEVSEEEVERALHDALDVIGAAWSIRALSVTAYDLRNMMRAALEAFVRGRGKS